MRIWWFGASNLWLKGWYCYYCSIAYPVLKHTPLNMNVHQYFPLHHFCSSTFVYYTDHKPNNKNSGGNKAKKTTLTTVIAIAMWFVISTCLINCCTQVLHFCKPCCEHCWACLVWGYPWQSLLRLLLFMFQVPLVPNMLPPSYTRLRKSLCAYNYHK